MRCGGQDGERLGHHSFATKMLSPAVVGPWSWNFETDTIVVPFHLLLMSEAVPLNANS